jgi:hypothetical protein
MSTVFKIVLIIEQQNNISVAEMPSGDINVDEYCGRSHQTLAREQTSEDARWKTVTVAVGGRQCGRDVTELCV